MRYTWKSEWPWIGLSRSPKVKSDGAIGLLLYNSPIVFNRNKWPKVAPLQDISLSNPCDIDCDLQRSLKVKSNGVIGLSVYDFILLFTETYGLTWLHIEIHTFKIWDLQFDLSRSLKVKYNSAFGLHIYESLLVSK